MNLHQIELFIAVAETGSFSRAAEDALLNQSTISQHIAALEEEVGSALLDRTPKGALTTASGKVFLRHARRIVSERDSLLQAMNSFTGLQNAHLTIGASNIPANYLIPAILPRLSESHPGISLTMTSGDSQDIVDTLSAAEIELAVVGSRFELKGINYEPLTNDTLVLVVGMNHPWRKRKTITVNELSEGRFIVREKGSGSGRTLENSLRTVGVEPENLVVTARLGSNEAVNQAVATGAGCAFVSEVSIRRQVADRELYKVDVEGLRVERQLWLATMRDRSLSPAAEAFRELLLEKYQ